MSAPDPIRRPAVDLGPRAAYVTMVAAQAQRADPLTFALAHAAARELAGSRLAVACTFGQPDWRALLRHTAAHAGQLAAVDAACDLVTRACCPGPAGDFGRVAGLGEPEPVYAAAGHVLEAAGVAGLLNLCVRPWTTAYWVRVALAALGPRAEDRARALVQARQEIAVIDLPLALA